MKVIPKSIHHLLDDSKGGIKKSYLEENYYDKDYIDDNFVSEADVSNFVTIQGPLQTVLGEKKLKNISLLNIPGTAPSSSDIDSGKSYLYSSYGSYAEVPGGGGGGGGETLTILRNGTQVATYNGSTPVSANILVPTTVASLSDASDYATKTWVENKGYITSAALSGYVTIDTDQEITGAKYFSNALAIPLSAPSSPTSGLSYLYAGSGSYAEEPGGGVADVYPLTITKNGSSWLYYDPGEEAVSVNLSVPTKVSDLTNDTGFITSSALNGYATQTWVEGKGYITSSALSGYVNDFEVTGSGNAVTTGSKSGSKITLTKGNTFVDLTSEQKITGAKKHANVALLNIPTSISSSDIESGKVYLYSGSGEYAEEASGGVADVYPLYLVIGGTTTTYDPASESTTVTFGSAAKKGYTTNITQGSTDLPTSGAVYSAIAAAVTSALHYRGMSSTALTDGGTETAIIGGVALVPQSGDVVIYGGFEFLWENSVWNKLGDDSSYALKTVQITAGTGLTGGGDLTASRTLSLSSATQTDIGKGVTAYNSLSNYLPLAGNSTSSYVTGPVYFDAGNNSCVIKNIFYNTTTGWSRDVVRLAVDGTNKFTIGAYGSYTSGGSGNGITYAYIGCNAYDGLNLRITSDSLKWGTNVIYHEGNLTKGVLTTLLESDGGYYLPLTAGSGKVLTGDLYFDSSSANRNIYWKDQNNVSKRAIIMDKSGGLAIGYDNPAYSKMTYVDGYYTLFRSGSSKQYEVALDASGIFRPTTTNYINLGSSSYRWIGMYAKGANLDTFLAIPQSAPSTSASWYSANDAYLYAGTSGDYSESAGGGVADVYPLTITKNGSAWLYYNPGTQAESINLAIPTKVSDLTNDTGFITASSIPSTYAWSAITNTPTTLSGYGITDAKIETPSGTSNRKITLGSNNFTIYSWSLASAKPSYTLDEVTDGSTRKLANYLPLTGGYISNSENNNPLKIKTTLANTNGVYLPFYVNTTKKTEVGYWSGYGAYLANTTGTTQHTLKVKDDGTLGFDSETVYHTGNLSLATLAGSSAIGSTSKPVYYNGSSLVACGTSLTDYLLLAGNAVASKITGNVILGNNVFLQGVHTNGTDVRELIGLDNNNIVTVGCSTNQLRLITSSVDIKHNKNGTLYSVYDESNLTKSVLTTLLDSNSGYYLPLTAGSSYPLTGDLYFDARTATRDILFKYGETYASGLRMTTDGVLYLGVNQIGKGKHSVISGTDVYVNWGSSSSTKQIAFTGSNIRSTTDNNINLGTSTFKWASVHATTGYLYGDLTIDASSAARYINIKDASNNSHQAIVMTTAGNLTIGNNQPTLGGMTVIRGGTISLAVGDSTTNEKYNVNFFGSNGQFYPTPDNAVTLGDSAKKFKAIYAYKYYGLLDDFTYLVNHAGNIDDIGVTNSKGVNFYYASSGTKPTGSQDGSTITLAYSNAWVTQMYGDWRTNKFYTRVRNNGTWGSWEELATKSGTVEGLNTSTESDATFTYRAVPSVAVGDVARATKVKGKTIVWNQLVPTNWFGTGTAATVSWTNNGDGSYTINGTANAVGQVVAFSPRKSFGDHKYYLATSDSTIAIYFNGTSANQGTYTDSRQIVTAQASDTYYPVIRFQSGATFSSKKVYIKIIDLTLMFGKGSEPASVAEFEALYPLPYYAYNPGELISNKTESIETVGFNLWDEDTMFLGVSGVTRTADGWAGTCAQFVNNGFHYWDNTINYTGQMCIYMKGTSASSGANFRFTFVYTDGTSLNGPYLSGTSVDEYVVSTPGKTVAYIQANYGSGRNIVIQKLCLSFYDASRNGQYEPYRKDTLPLNITKLKVDTTNLWDEQWGNYGFDSNGVKTANANQIATENYIPVSPSTAYIFCYGGSTDNILYVYEYTDSKGFLKSTRLVKGATLTTSATTGYIQFALTSAYGNTYNHDIWINTPTKRPPLKLNQMFENGDFSNGTTGWGYYNSSISAQNGALSVQVTQVNGGFTTTSDKNPTLIGGHKYFIQYAFNSPSATSTFVYFNGNSFIAGKNVKAGYNVYAGIGTISTTATGPVIARFNATGTYTVYSIVLIDLTKMYSQGLEPTDTEIVSERIGLYRPYTTGEYMPYYAFPKGMRCADYACSVCDEVIGKQAIVKVGAVDLGLMAWTRDSSGIFYTGSVPGSVSRTSGTTHMILPKYNQKNASSSIGGASSNGDYCQAGARIAIYDTGYSDAVSFQRSLNSVKLYFELSTPIFYDLETAVPELIECDVLGTQRRLPEDTASSVQAPFHCDFQYGANPGEIVSDSAYRYLPLAGGTVYGTLEASGELIIPDHAPYQPEPNKHYLYVNDNGNYYQS